MNQYDLYLHKEINYILWAEWDPLQLNKVVPVDEYGSYAKEILEIKKAGEGKEKIVKALSGFEERMACNIGIKKRTQVADKILNIPDAIPDKPVYPTYTRFSDIKKRVRQLTPGMEAVPELEYLCNEACRFFQQGIQVRTVIEELYYSKKDEEITEDDFPAPEDYPPFEELIEKLENILDTEIRAAKALPDEKERMVSFKKAHAKVIRMLEPLNFAE